MTDLEKLGEKYLTDKWSRHSYLPLYEQLFAPFRHLPIDLLEIGIGLGSPSLLMWREWFTNGVITGIDKEPAYANPLSEYARVQLVSGDATQRNVLATLLFDIIIDDGSHDPEQQIMTLCARWANFRSGGLYLIEDVSPENVPLFEPFAPIVFDRRSLSKCEDDILLLLRKPR